MNEESNVVAAPNDAERAKEPSATEATTNATPEASTPTPPAVETAPDPAPVPVPDTTPASVQGSTPGSASALTETPTDVVPEVEPEAVETPAVETPAAAPIPAASSVADSAAPEAAPTTDTSPAPEAPAAEAGQPDDADRPSERIRIGTQREDAASAPAADLKPKPVNPVTEGDGTPTDTKHYPPPNAKAAPTDEEEAELDKLMEGASSDQVLDAEAAAAPPEIASGTKLKGKVVKVTEESVFVEIGTHQQGIVPSKQFEPKSAQAKPSPEAAPAEPAAAPAEGAAAESQAGPAEPESHLPAEGAELDVVVHGLNTDEGLYDLTLPTAAVDVGDWDEVEVGKIVEVTITGKNKGGLECKVSGIRGFMPMGQISIFRVENPEEYVGQRLTAVITEANRSRKNVILSHRAVMERERAEKRDQLLAELKPGQLRDGVVRSIRDFGAFVDLGGVDGMVHVSKLSWDRVTHPKEILSEGQAVKVKIEKIDAETGKIALSYRDSAPNPWDSAEADFPVGSSVKGKVSKTMDFGAFVRLGAGVEGLIHISELDYKRVHRVTDVVSEGEEVEAKVLSVDRGKQRIALSLKALKAPPKVEKPAAEAEPETEEPPRKRKNFKNLKGGISTPSGGEQFGLKW